MTTIHIILAYLGPDQVLPLTTVVASAVGVVLMFWNTVVRIVRWPFQRSQNNPSPEQTQDQVDGNSTPNAIACDNPKRAA